MGLRKATCTRFGGWGTLVLWYQRVGEHWYCGIRELGDIGTVVSESWGTLVLWYQRVGGHWYCGIRELGDIGTVVSESWETLVLWYQRDEQHIKRVLDMGHNEFMLRTVDVYMYKFDWSVQMCSLLGIMIRATTWLYAELSSPLYGKLIVKKMYLGITAHIPLGDIC